MGYTLGNHGVNYATTVFLMMINGQRWISMGGK